MNSIESPLFEQLRVINNVFENAIDEEPTDYPELYRKALETLQNTHLLKTQLMPNQSRLIASMVVHRQRMRNGFVRNGQMMRGKLGILADPPGSGKSLAALTYLMPHVQALLDPHTIQDNELNPNSNRYFFSHGVSNHRLDTSCVDILIVPPHLIQQWTVELDTHTRLEYIVLDNRRTLRNKTTPSLIINNKLMIISTRMYKDVYDFCQDHQITWRHVIIDEAAAAHISPNDSLPSFEFMWLITSNWLGFLFKNVYINPHDLEYIRDRIPLNTDCEIWLDAMIKQDATISTPIEASNFIRNLIPWNHKERSALILRNSSENQIVYPSVESQTIDCAVHFTIGTIPQLFIKNNYEGMTHEHLPLIFKALSVQEYSMDRIKELFESRLSLIKEKEGDDCSICLESVQHKVMLPCCMNFFCGACIFKHLLSQIYAKCPTCRAELYFPNMMYVPTITNQDISSNPVLNKHETCVDYILKHPNESHIVYSPFENNYYQVYPRLQERGIQCELVENHIAKFNKTIGNFHSGSTKVLFISTMEMIRGLNLTLAKHLIFFGKCFSYEVYNVLLHSVLRVGRKPDSPLKLVHLKSCLE
jgi:hypothetical protein